MAKSRKGKGSAVESVPVDTLTAARAADAAATADAHPADRHDDDGGRSADVYDLTGADWHDDDISPADPAPTVAVTVDQIAPADPGPTADPAPTVAVEMAAAFTGAVESRGYVSTVVIGETVPMGAPSFDGGSITGGLIAPVLATTFTGAVESRKPAGPTADELAAAQARAAALAAAQAAYADALAKLAEAGAPVRAPRARRTDADRETIGPRPGRDQWGRAHGTAAATVNAVLVKEGGRFIELGDIIDAGDIVEKHTRELHPRADGRELLDKARSQVTNHLNAMRRQGLVEHAAGRGWRFRYSEMSDRGLKWYGEDDDVTPGDDTGAPVPA